MDLLGETVEFKVAVNKQDVTYQWYYSNDGGKKWGKISDDDNDPTTLKVVVMAYRNGYLYKCVVTGANGEEVTSEYATLKAKSANMVITSEPESETNAKVGERYTFHVNVTADIGELTYQWYYSNDGVNWGKISDDDNDPTTLTVEMMAYRDGYRYKCVITDVYGISITSQEATLKIKDTKLTVSQQPESDENAKVGEIYTFHVGVTADTEELVYQWYYSNNGGANWGKCNSINSVNYNTETLTVPMQKYLNGYLFKCVITDEYGNVVETEVVTLKIKDTRLAITQDPASKVNATVGDEYTFHVGVTADTEELIYQWYYSNNGGANWGKCSNSSSVDGATSDTLTITMLEYRDGYLYRCVVTDKFGNVVTSEKAILSKQEF